MENKTRVLFKTIFSHLEKGDYKLFWDCFSEDVTWIIEGTHPLAGKYKSLSEFRKSMFDRLQQALASPLKFKVKDMLVNSVRGAVILESDSITHDGAHYHERSCWIVDIGANDKIDHVDCFVNSQLLTDLFSTLKVGRR